MPRAHLQQYLHERAGLEILAAEPVTEHLKDSQKLLLTPPGANSLRQLTSENLGPDAEFERIAKLNRLPIHPVSD